MADTDLTGPPSSVEEAGAGQRSGALEWPVPGVTRCRYTRAGSSRHDRLGVDVGQQEEQVGVQGFGQQASRLRHPLAPSQRGLARLTRVG
jgi:hypothetical protein